MMTWKRRRSRSVAEARMRIGKTQFSSLHQPVCRLACITSVAIMVVVVVVVGGGGGGGGSMFTQVLLLCEADLDTLQRSVVLLRG